jgi:hypothetical protein
VAGQYAQVRYLAGPAAASRLGWMATSIGLTALQFVVGDRVMAHELPALQSVIDNVDEASAAAETAPVVASDFPRPSPADVVPQCSASEEPVETLEQREERQRVINEMLGYGEPARRRRWRRGSG